jgi:hypothetical protein
MPEDRTGEEPTYGEPSGQRPEYGPGSGGEDPDTGTDTGTGQPNEDLHGEAREVQESANEGPAETPGGG